MDYDYDDEDELQQLFSQFVPQDDPSANAEYTGMQGNLSPTDIRDKLIAQNPGAASMFGGGNSRYVDEPGAFENQDAPAANDFTGGPQNRAVRPQVTDDQDDFGPSYGATGGAPSGAGMGSGLGQYRGRNVESYDQGLPDRTAQTSSYVHSLADNRAARAVDNQRGGIDLGSLPLRYATTGGVLLGSKWDTQGLVNSLNRRYDEENKADEQHATRAQRDEDIITKYVKDAYENTKGEEQKDYQRGRDATQDARADERFQWDKERQAAELEDRQSTRDLHRQEIEARLSAAQASANKAVAKYVDEEGRVIFETGSGTLRYSDGSDANSANIKGKVGEKEARGTKAYFNGPDGTRWYNDEDGDAHQVTDDNGNPVKVAGAGGAAKGNTNYGGSNKAATGAVDGMFAREESAPTTLTNLDKAETALNELREKKIPIPGSGVGNTIRDAAGSIVHQFWDNPGQDSMGVEPRNRYSQAAGTITDAYTSAANKGQGAVTDNERKMFEKHQGLMGSDYNSAQVVIDGTRALEKRNMEMAQGWREAIDSGQYTANDLGNWRSKFLREHPLTSYDSSGRLAGVLGETTRAAPRLSAPEASSAPSATVDSGSSGGMETPWGPAVDNGNGTIRITSGPNAGKVYRRRQ